MRRGGRQPPASPDPKRCPSRGLDTGVERRPRPLSPATDLLAADETTYSPRGLSSLAMALRPRLTASVITSRNGSQALALGARPGGLSPCPGSVDTSSEMAGLDPPESVDTPCVVAGFAGPGSVDTSPEMAGFEARLGPAAPTAHRHPGGLEIPAGRLAADRRSLPRSAAATSPAAPAPILAASCRRSRRCSSRRRNTTPTPPASPNGRFSGVHQWPVLGVARGHRTFEVLEPALGLEPRTC